MDDPSDEPPDHDPAHDEVGAGRATIAVAALAAVLVVLAVAGIRTLEHDPGLAIVGDSITLVSAPTLEEELGGDHDVDIRSALGVRVDAMQAEASTAAAAGPPQAVIELGSNDVLQGADLAESARQLEQMVATFRDTGAECVHIVNVSTRMWTNAGEWTGERAAQLNESTATLAEADPAVVIVDWNAAVVAADEAGQTLTPDTVHPNGEGMRTLASLVADSVEAGCDRG